MKKNRRPIQRSLDVLAPVPAKKALSMELLIGEPFVSPIARIPTNRGLLASAEMRR